MNETLNLPVEIFDAILREVYIDKYLQSDEGIQMLKDYKRLHTTEADVNGLEKMFGSKIKINKIEG